MYSAALTVALFCHTFSYGTEVTGEVQSGNSSKWINAVISYHERVLSDRCLREHGVHHVDLIRTEFHEFINCTQTTMVPGNFIRLLSSASSTTRFPDVEIFCESLMENYERCLHPLVSALKGCTDIEGDHDLDDLTSLIYTGLHYLCADQGQQIKDMLSNKVMECVEENADQVKNCSHGLAQLLKNIDENYSIFSKEDCKIQWTTYDCISDAVSSCSEQYAAQFWNKLVHLTMEKTRCNTSAAISLSKSTWLSLASVMWLLFVDFH